MQKARNHCKLRLNIATCFPALESDKPSPLNAIQHTGLPKAITFLGVAITRILVVSGPGYLWKLQFLTPKAGRVKNVGRDCSWNDCLNETWSRSCVLPSELQCRRLVAANIRTFRPHLRSNIKRVNRETEMKEAKCKLWRHRVTTTTKTVRG